MHVVIAGGSGLLGQALTESLAGDGHRVTLLGRRTQTESPDHDGPGSVQTIVWRPDGSAGTWSSTLEAADAVVNLAGAGIADKRWTTARKAELRSSRLLSTRSLVRAIETLTTRPAVFVQGSAMGYYGAWLDDRPFDESAPPGTDFLGQLAADWEAEAAPIAALGCRMAIVRTGLVLDTRGGALPQIALPFKLFSGGPMASGRQVISWIHVDDWTRLVRWILDTPSATGAFNAVAPHPATSREFARTLGRVLHRPSLFPVPAFVLRAAVGEMAEHGLIRGQHLVPTRALAAGFAFAHPRLDAALSDLYARGR